MDIFVKNMDAIRTVALHYHHLFKGKYEVEELINEAYIKFDRAVTNNPKIIEEKFSNPKLLLTRVKNDIKDFIRDDTKFRTRQRWEKSGKAFPEFKSYSFQVDKDSDTEFFEPTSHYTEYDIEREDLFDALFAKVELSKDEWEIIQRYFYEEKPMKKVGEEIGFSEAAIYNKTTKMCKKLLTCAERSRML